MHVQYSMPMPGIDKREGDPGKSTAINNDPGVTESLEKRRRMWL
jgi:hypothetical protein